MRQTADQDRMGVSEGGVSGLAVPCMRQTADQDRMGVSVGGVSGADCTLYETDSWSGQDGRVSGRGIRG
jgi:hypothetical protein